MEDDLFTLRIILLHAAVSAGGQLVLTNYTLREDTLNAIEALSKEIRIRGWLPD